MTDGRVRCGWCGDDPLYVAYHDTEWGVPLRDDRTLLEFLVLEGAQAGLSWLTILRRREGYRRAFDGFDPERVAGYGDADVRRLLADQGIIRNRRKVESAIRNARAFLGVQRDEGSFSDWIWSFVDGVPIQNEWCSLDEVPAATSLSDLISHELKRRGFSFVGPTIVYAHMQATGMVNDHLTGCFRWAEVCAMGEAR